MKINSADNIILTDLHDTLIHSKKAWIKAFEIVCGKNSPIYQHIRDNYDAVWKRKVCEENNINYDDVTNVYLKYIKRKKSTIKFIKNLNCKVILVSNAKRYRILQDISILEDIEFYKIYGREDGIKPDNDYMLRILDENKIQNTIMLGNDKDKDIFETNRIKTIMVENKSCYKLKKEYERLIKELK